MPNWRTKLFSSVCRVIVKGSARKPIANEAEGAKRVRRMFEPPEFLRPKLSADAKIEAVNEGGVSGEWVECSADAGAPQRTVYYLHGGGYIACSPATHRGFTTNLARAAKARVFALDYRRAPEHKFPAALEDAVAGYRLLLEKGERPDRIVVGGDSAGGGLAAALLIALRDRGLPLPGAAFLLSPWTDLAGTGASLSSNERSDPMLSGRMVHQLARLYHGEASPSDPLVSPLYGDLIGLPPLLIYVSNSEILRDDAVRLYERARRHRVEAELRIENDLPHVWPIFVAFGLPEARRAVAEIAEFIRQQTSVQSLVQNSRFSVSASASAG